MAKDVFQLWNRKLQVYGRGTIIVTGGTQRYNYITKSAIVHFHMAHNIDLRGKDTSHIIFDTFGR